MSGKRLSEREKWGLFKLALLFVEATKLESEKFAAIGAKFCTKYVKISQKFHSQPDLLAINQKQSIWVDLA